jgi:hypothetical protein
VLHKVKVGGQMTSAEVLRGSRNGHRASSFGQSACRRPSHLPFSILLDLHERDPWQTAAMSLLRHLSRPRQYVCQRCIRRQHTLARGERPTKGWAAEEADAGARKTAWEEQAGRIRSGAQQSMLGVLEERGFVKDVAG